MLREELGPINSGLWVALMIVEACGFHGTLATRHQAGALPLPCDLTNPQ
jgi:hypothetical protein